MWYCLVFLAFFATAQARAVNISNTWVLPEEGFPVFYRYFRDRISWYEADAVCQFHHANLVTVDTTAQYDAVRAYLKELDISSAVWVGLIRSNPDGDFTWTDYRGLSGDGYWSSAPDGRSAPLCAAADPTADYRWEAQACGGPTVASFICELPVPQWALGNEGCMVRALPALTILYLPESAAVQLTADCGLAEVKRVQCTGNVKREQLLKDLSCTEEVELSSPSDRGSFTGNTWSTTTDEIVTDTQGPILELSTEKSIISETDGVINELNVKKSTFTYYDRATEIIPRSKSIYTTVPPLVDGFPKIIPQVNINLDVIDNNDLHSNDIKNDINIESNNPYYDQETVEDENYMKHKQLHDELARLGNFETIFTQPTDHFIPPLVIAKAKIGEDMNVLTFKEKHAQDFAAHKLIDSTNERNHVEHTKSIDKSDLSETNLSNSSNITTQSTVLATTLMDKTKKDYSKNIVPKKYTQQYYLPKINNFKNNYVQNKTRQSKSYIKTLPSDIINETGNTLENSSNTILPHEYQQDVSMDLTVILKESGSENIWKPKEIQIKLNKTKFDVKKFEIKEKELKTKKGEQKDSTFSAPNNTLHDVDGIDNASSKQEIITVITTGDGNNLNAHSTIDEVTTKAPIFKDNVLSTSPFTMPTTIINNIVQLTTTEKNETVSTFSSGLPTTHVTPTLSEMNISFTKLLPNNNEIIIKMVNKSDDTIPTKSNKVFATLLNITESNNDTYHESLNTNVLNVTQNSDENLDEVDKKSNDTDFIDDFQSPLLSGASEPLHRPNRSRRPQQPNRINKFNPFRIIG